MVVDIHDRTAQLPPGMVIGAPVLIHSRAIGPNRSPPLINRKTPIADAVAAWFSKRHPDFSSHMIEALDGAAVEVSQKRWGRFD
ncbi:hypothetical protein [Oleomonas cavernae]|nr:hypothetical protein [Oleomonas cavernae]